LLCGELSLIRIIDALKTYYEVTKPVIVYLLVFTAFAAAFVADPGIGRPYHVLAAVVAVFLGSAAANTITGYIDRDIDAVMGRTKARPIPSGRIHPPEKALYFGVVLAVMSVLLASSANILAGIFMLAGLFDNIVIYSRFLKRRTPLNILLGGFSGAMPVLVGYSAVTGTIDLISVVMAALVFLWIPAHIWSLALHAREDYKTAHVPMLPVVVDEKKSVRVIALTVFLMVAASLVPFLIDMGRGFGIVYMAITLAMGVVTMGLGTHLLIWPSVAKAWRLFKFSSPYLAFIFLAIMVDALIT
jgi:protoheme IX farnesyltransferase|tara:strand:+ start:297 stop:1199 length:903 start_codon:yes stop_codon:yes gene_type:complete